MDRYDIWFGTDGDYVIHQRLLEGIWWPVSSWLIPNSQIED
jgi:hypothetical protein